MNTLGRFTETEIATAELDVQWFNQALAGEGMQTVKLRSDMPNDVVSLAHEICTAMRHKLYIVDTMRFKATGYIINGMALDGVAFVSYPTLHDDVVWTIGHEMWHAGEQMNPATFEQSLAKVISNCHPGLVNHRRNFESDRTVSDRHVQSEVLADFNGEMWIDPIFWNALAASLKNQNVGDLYKKMGSMLESKARSGRFGVSYFNKEIAELRNELVALWSHHIAMRSVT